MPTAPTVLTAKDAGAKSVEQRIGTACGGSEPSNRSRRPQVQILPNALCIDNKLYIVTRANLPPGARAAQSAHAAFAFASEHPELCSNWMTSSNNLVLLEVEDEPQLVQLIKQVVATGVKRAVFREPDFDDAITAVALAPEAASLVSNLRLALRDVA